MSIIFRTFAKNSTTMIVGRAEEIRQLKRAYASEYSEFVAVYGRRRIGKTFLIRECFKNCFTFQYTGVWNISNKEQLEEFYQNLIRQGLSTESKPPKSWFEAFHLLEDLIIASRQEKKIIFLDAVSYTHLTLPTNSRV